MFESFGLSDVGCLRSANQDRILTDHGLGAFIVADGMGGESHGELAAEIAISTLRYYLDSSQDRFDITWPFGYRFELSIDANRLYTGIQLANQQVWRHAQQGPEFAGMGTTIAGLLLSEQNVIAANVGDSRIYLLREAALRQLSYDDTFVNSIAQRSGLTAVDLESHPMRSVLTQAAGTRESLNVHIQECRIEDGDTFLICSDGLHSVISDAAIRNTMGAADGVENIVVRLIDGAKAAGGPDNVSCILVRFEI